MAVCRSHTLEVGQGWIYSEEGSLKDSYATLCEKSEYELEKFDVLDDYFSEALKA